MKIMLIIKILAVFYAFSKSTVLGIFLLALFSYEELTKIQERQKNPTLPPPEEEENEVDEGNEVEEWQLPSQSAEFFWSYKDFTIEKKGNIYTVILPDGTNFLKVYPSLESAKKGLDQQFGNLTYDPKHKRSEIVNMRFVK